MQLLAIDPGSRQNCGIAVMSNGKITKTYTSDQFEVYKLIESNDFDVVIFEDARLIKGVFGKRSAQNIGVLKGVCKNIDTLAKRHKAKCFKVKPCGLDRIANTTFFDTYPQYRGKVMSEHERVAVMLFDCVDMKRINK